MNKPILAIIALTLLAGCVSERVVLLPSPEGKPSAVVVRDRSGGEQVLNQPYAATIRRLGMTRPYQDDPEAVNSRYAQTLQARPQVPVSFVLYFESASDRLTQESTAKFSQIRDELAARAAPEIMIIGHTDRLGPAAANDALSLQRALAVRQLLADAGLPTEKLEVAGRGEREPLVATADEVEEARNRRVEINIR